MSMLRILGKSVKGATKAKYEYYIVIDAKRSPKMSKILKSSFLEYIYVETDAEDYWQRLEDAIKVGSENYIETDGGISL